MMKKKKKTIKVLGQESSETIQKLSSTNFRSQKPWSSNKAVKMILGV